MLAHAPDERRWLWLFEEADAEELYAVIDTNRACRPRGMAGPPPAGLGEPGHQPRLLDRRGGAGPRRRHARRGLDSGRILKEIASLSATTPGQRAARMRSAPRGLVSPARGRRR